MDGELWSRLLAVWGRQGMREDSGRFLFVADKTAYMPGKGTGHLWAKGEGFSDKVQGEIKSFPTRGGKSILLNLIASQPLQGATSIQGDILAGAQALHKWQSKAKDIFLWHDHLPALAMKVNVGGKAVYISLIERDCAVLPRLGQQVELPPIRVAMSLPAGVKEISFPLRIGTQRSAARYQATLRSSRFPLRKSAPVTLSMFYTYGEPEPYELIFTMEDGAKLRAEWEEMGERPIEPWMIPAFPPRPAQMDVLSKKKYGREKKEAIPFLCEWLEDLVSSAAFMSGYGDTNRVTLYVDEWREDRNGKYYGFADYEGDEVFVGGMSTQVGAYGRKPTFDIDEHEVSCELEDNDKGRTAYRAVHISQGHSVDESYSYHKWRAPIFALRSLGLPLQRMPELWQKALAEYLPQLACILDETEEREMRQAILRFASVLGEDMPSTLGNKLVEAYATQKYRSGWNDIDRWAGYALGSVSKPWQKELLVNLFARPNFSSEHDHLLLFAQAFWRDDRFAGVLSGVQVEAVKNLLLQSAAMLVTLDNERWDMRRLYTAYFETVLGLMQARRNDAECQKLLHPDSLDDLASATDEVIAHLKKKELSLESFLKLTVDTRLVPQGGSPLVYAARSMITCENEDESRLIKVESISDEA